MPNVFMCFIANSKSLSTNWFQSYNIVIAFFFSLLTATAEQLSNHRSIIARITSGLLRAIQERKKYLRRFTSSSTICIGRTVIDRCSLCAFSVVAYDRSNQWYVTKDTFNVSASAEKNRIGAICTSRLDVIENEIKQKTTYFWFVHIWYIYLCIHRLALNLGRNIDLAAITTTDWDTEFIVITTSLPPVHRTWSGAMSPKQWLALFCFYISYLFFGASVFYHIEHEAEAQRRVADLESRLEINGKWYAFAVNIFSVDDLRVI